MTSAITNGRKPSDDVLVALRSRLVRGEWPPGGKMPTIEDTADHYTVSRSLVQRVYADLKKEGLLYAVPGHGTFVSPLTSQDDEVLTILRHHPEAVDIATLIDDALEAVHLMEQRASQLKVALHAARQRITSLGS